MNLISKISIAMAVILSISSCNTQIKNAKTELVKIYGNCEMCEKTIETAGNIKKIAAVDWNKDNKIATITYDSTQTNQSEILQRIAWSGYDNEQFLAPDDTYAKLPSCCQYERKAKAPNEITTPETTTTEAAIPETQAPTSKTATTQAQTTNTATAAAPPTPQAQTPATKTETLQAQTTKTATAQAPATKTGTAQAETTKNQAQTETTKTQAQTTNTATAPAPATKAATTTTQPTVSALKAVFDTYFALKDALVKTDASLASDKAKEMLLAINAVKMEQLPTDQHIVFMKVRSSLQANTEKISATTNVEKQRNTFMDLSANLYDLAKVSEPENPIYYQNCPMYNDGKGANWLSKENAVKNPYYGSQMLTCGKTIEVIK
jgi:copper chaperone CopZ